MNRLLAKITTPLLVRVVIFLSLFVLISGLIGSRIVGGGIVYRDGFALYGGFGKAAIFGLIAFVLLVRRKGFSVKLAPWRPALLVWLAISGWLAVVSWMSVSSLLAGDRSDQNLILAHGGLILSAVTAAIGSIGPANLQLLRRLYGREVLLAAVITGLFYLFLMVVYTLWMPLAAIVLVSVDGLLAVARLPADLIPPNTLVTDKFGITIAKYCSGIESIALFSGLYAIVGLLERERLNVRRYMLLFPLALVILFALNILRVFGLIMAGYYINAEIAFSLFHTYAGMVFFILYSVIFWAVAYKYIVKPSGPTSPFMAQENLEQTATTPKRIVISHVYSSDNKGDAALTSVLIKDIKQRFPRATITILKLGPTKQNSHFEGVREKSSFMYYVTDKFHNPFLKLAYAAYMTNATLVWAVWYRWTGWQLYLPTHLRKIALIYQRADLIVPVGGGYLRSRKGLVNRFNIPLLLHPLFFGYLLGKPTVLYPQSFGPFQNKLEELLVALALRRMTLILVRENTSVELLAVLGVTKNITRAVDSGFLLISQSKINVRKRYHVPADKLLVGVTVRSWLASDAQEKYEKAVAVALDQLTETLPVHVIFIPQVTAAKGDDDRIASRRVQQYMHNTAATMVIDDAPDHHQIKAIYDDLDILLGTRFHSVIFSLTSFVPVLAIEYEHKTSGIMHDLKLDRWVIKIEDVTAARLTRLLKKLMREKNQYSVLLRKRVPPYIAKARESAGLLAESYYAAIRKDVKKTKRSPRNRNLG